MVSYGTFSSIYDADKVVNAFITSPDYYIVMSGTFQSSFHCLLVQFYSIFLTSVSKRTLK